MAGFEILLAFFIYLTLFAWIGWQRGYKRELVVFGVASLVWIVLMSRGDIMVSIANLGGKFLAFLEAGGLSGNTEDAFGAIGDAPDWVTDDNRQGYLFAIWMGVVVLTYILTTIFMSVVKNGWAILVGLLNGFLYAAILLPRLVGLVVPDAEINPVTSSTNAFFVLIGSTIDLLLSAFGSIWDVIKPAAPVTFLIFVIILIVVATSSLRASS